MNKFVKTTLFHKFFPISVVHKSIFQTMLVVSMTNLTTFFAGDHSIVFTFDPQEVHKTESIAKTSVYIILLLVLAALGWGVYSGLRRKKVESRE